MQGEHLYNTFPQILLKLRILGGKKTPTKQQTNITFGFLVLSLSEVGNPPQPLLQLSSGFKKWEVQHQYSLVIVTYPHISDFARHFQFEFIASSRQLDFFVWQVEEPSLIRFLVPCRQIDIYSLSCNYHSLLIKLNRLSYLRNPKSHLLPSHQVLTCRKCDILPVMSLVPWLNFSSDMNFC